ncbi:MAG: M16 family metallopeptidase [Gemmatimonadales bacterium]
MKRPFLLVAALSLAFPAPASAQYRVDYETFTLDNGLRVIMAQDRSAPIVTINVWYNVGSANERPGRSGFAHLFEHMMFYGSENVGQDEYMATVLQAGGTLNGTTNNDRTAYYETLPSNRLNLGLWLEADRMRGLVINAEKFETQRNAVQEERRLRVDNRPYKAFSEGPPLAYDSTTCFAYAHTVIGSMDDLNAAQVPDVEEFFHLYYAPNNATLAVVGDFDANEARALIEQYYGDIPRGAEPPQVGCEYQYSAGAESMTWPDPLATIPAVLIIYNTPPHDDADTRALNLLGRVLSSGQSSRIYRALVRESRSALQAGGGAGGYRRAGNFTLFGIANQGVDINQVAEELREQIALVVADGATEEELQRAKNQLRSGTIFGNQTTMAISNRLQHYAHDHADLEEINTELDAFMSITVEDLQRVAAQYLTDENSFTIIVEPDTEAEEGGVS